MRFLTLAAYCSLLALAGCASTPSAPDTVPSTRSSTSHTNPYPYPVTSATPRSPGRAKAPSGAQLPSRALSPIASAQANGQSVAQLAAPVDVWERIRRGFAMPDLDSPLVHDREQWYASRPDYIYRMTERSRKYLFHIVEELELRGMPTELALLPFIESAFNPQAVSSAKAAGMWQFMPATGRSFELKQNAFRDDRRDVLASTRAALDYLQKLHGMFGDWQLALAAYNWGEGSVSRAIAKNNKASLGLSYTDLSMPMETRLYVPKLQAVKNIVANPSAFDARLPDIGNHPYFQTVDIRHDIDVALAARLAEVPLEDFKALNPSATKPVILASGTPQILLPWDNATVFEANLAAYTGTRLASWTVWLAPTTMKAADAAQRVGMSEAELRQLNNIPPRMLIKAGSSLLVLRGSHTEGDVSQRVADNAQLSFAPEQVQQRTTIKVGKKDSLASIAKRYGQSPAKVAQWNHLSASATLKRGQILMLYVPASVRTASRSAAPARGKPQAVAKARAPSVKGVRTAQAKPRAAGRMAKTAKAVPTRKTAASSKKVRVAQR